MLKAMHVMNLSLFEPQIAEIRLRLAIVNLNRQLNQRKIKQKYCSKKFLFVVKSKEKRAEEQRRIIDKNKQTGRYFYLRTDKDSRKQSNMILK